MKKLIALLMIFFILVPICAFALPSSPTLQPTVVLKGNIAKEFASENKDITILLKKKNATYEDGDYIGYVNQIPVNEDGSYQHEFKFYKNIEDYEFLLQSGENDVTNTLMVAKYAANRIKSEISYREENSKTIINTNLRNPSDDNVNYIVIAAAYNEDGTMLDLDMSGAKTINANGSVSEDAVELNVTGASVIKCFIWEGMKTLLPYANENIEEKPFVAYAWYLPETEAQENIYQMFYVAGHSGSSRPDDSENAMCNLATESATVAAEKMKRFMENKPVGGRVIMPIMSRLIHDPNLDDTRTFDNWFWWDEGIQKNVDILNELLSAYKAIDGPAIDAIVLDYEIGCDSFNMNWDKVGGSTQLNDAQMEERYQNVIDDPRYLSDIKPELEKMGFTFYAGGDHNELYYYWKKPTASSTDIHRNSYYTAQLYATERKNFYLNKIYTVVKEYYPSVAFSNYGNAILEKNTDTFQTVPSQNYRKDILYAERKTTGVGTHSAPVLYGAVPTTVSNNPPTTYAFSTFKKTPFNGALATIQQLRDSVRYAENTQLQPWVGNRTWDYNDNVWFASTDYYKEVILHIGLHNANQMLFFNNATRSEAWAHDDILLSNLLKELTEVAGFSNRKCISLDKVDINKRYLLSGMYVNGKNVWRITPDVNTPEGSGHVTKESFLVDESNLIFRIGNQIIDFPEGSYIYNATDEQSQIGYWIYSPAGTYPEEYIDSNYTAPAESDYEFVADAELERLKLELN